MALTTVAEVGGLVEVNCGITVFSSSHCWGSLTTEEMDDVKEMVKSSREERANDTSLTAFPSRKVNYIFPSEDTFSAATKLFGLLEKR